MPNIGNPDRGVWIRRRLVFALLLVVMGTALWWAAGRWTAGERRLVVRHAEVAVPTPSSPDEPDRIIILAWNIAHGRGDVGPGWFQNWRGGTPRQRAARLVRMAQVLREVDADVVVLNEVDFDSHWSDGVNQAGVLARAAGYPVRVEQRNFDVRTPVGNFAFGNAVLSRLPVEELRWVPLPPHSRLEAFAFGNKNAALVKLETPLGSVAVLPVHLDPRSEATRLAAVPVLDTLRAREPAPIVLAGDFNTAPPAWPGTAGRTAVGSLLESGWTSPRTMSAPGPSQATFPSWEPDRALDWILTEPPVEVVEARTVPEAAELSDHLPVMAVLGSSTITSSSIEELARKMGLPIRVRGDRVEILAVGIPTPE